MPKIIGTVTTYLGSDHAYLRGYEVRILALYRPIPDSEDSEMFKTDDEVAAAGGVQEGDWADVAPIMAAGRTSFVSSDASVVDLECFAHLRRP